MNNEIIDLTNIEKDTTQIEMSADEIIIPLEIWNLIRENTKNAPFRVTPPNFNCFRQEKPHWLETPKVPWKILNTSIVKCQNWLEEYYE